MSGSYLVVVDRLCLTFDLEGYRLSKWVENDKVNEKKVDESLRLLNKQLTMLDEWRIFNEVRTRWSECINLHIARLEFIRIFTVGGVGGV